jgi:hypothetical protein
MHHVELLMDRAGERAITTEWTRLAEAGLPSLALHRHPSNRPHLTVTISDDWPLQHNGELGSVLAAALPLRLELGSLLCFGAGPWVLVRMVVVTEPLLRLHRQVVELLGPAAVPHCRPGHWVPHVSLARRLDGPAVARALQVLSGAPIRCRLDGARHWDSAARCAEPLGLVG